MTRMTPALAVHGVRWRYRAARAGWAEGSEWKGTAGAIADGWGPAEARVSKAARGHVRHGLARAHSEGGIWMI